MLFFFKFPTEPAYLHGWSRCCFNLGKSPVLNRWTHTTIALNATDWPTQLMVLRSHCFVQTAKSFPWRDG